MSKTPVQAMMSSSLKERLKKCGRYHASPETVPRQANILTSTLNKRKMVNRVHNSEESVIPNVKRQCLDDESSNLHSDNELSNNNRLYQSPVPTKRHTQSFSCGIDSKERQYVNKTVTDSSVGNCSLNQTPISQRSRSSLLKVKGNKLNFEYSSGENIQNSDNKMETVLHSKGDAVKLKTENLAKSDFDLPLVSKRNLQEELETKEEELRKLRMVKMYRSKNDLEELQTLIDKWRTVSQQAIQDLHSAMPEPRPSLTELINHLGIDHELLHFSSEEDETFF